ncbi:diguanylate cyclase [Bacillus sp. DX4.1]|nr:diguanylate cyclase [Bacillus sp. DX4.1]
MRTFFCFVKKHYLYRNIRDKKLKQLLQNVENIILKTVRKSDVVTRWKDNKYVLVAVDNGYEQSTLIDRLLTNVTKELQNDVVNITILFGVATYPLEGNSFENLFHTAQARLYKNGDVKTMGL